MYDTRSATTSGEGSWEFAKSGKPAIYPGEITHELSSGHGCHAVRVDTHLSQSRPVHATFLVAWKRYWRVCEGVVWCVGTSIYVPNGVSTNPGA